MVLNMWCICMELYKHTNGCRWNSGNLSKISECINVSIQVAMYYSWQIATEAGQSTKGLSLDHFLQWHVNLQSPPCKF